MNIIQKAMKFLGQLSKIELKDYELEDGSVLSVIEDSGEATIDTETATDGTYKAKSGEEITVKDGIATISEPEQKEESEPAKEEAAEEPAAPGITADEVAAMVKENEDLKAEIERLKAEIEAAKGEQLKAETKLAEIEKEPAAEKIKLNTTVDVAKLSPSQKRLAAALERAKK